MTLLFDVFVNLEHRNLEENVQLADSLQHVLLFLQGYDDHAQGKLYNLGSPHEMHD